MWYIFLTIVIVGMVLTFTRKRKKVLFHYHLKDLKQGDDIALMWGNEVVVGKVIHNSPTECTIILNVKGYNYTLVRRYGDPAFLYFKK